MVSIAIMGHGVVGSGVAEILLTHKQKLFARLGEEIYIKKVLDLREFPDSPIADRFTKDFEEIINDLEIRVVVEVMGGLHPSYEFVSRCIKAGKSVVTSNKELVAAYGAELLALAKENNVNFLFEASVGGGIPIIRPMNQCLVANIVDEIAGILNGTTNFILTKMIEDGMQFADALKLAQELGYAEKDPTADVEGHDSCRKICIISSLVFGKHVYPESVYTKGISQVDLTDVAAADVLGSAIKLVASVRQLPDGRILPVVMPTLIPHENIMAGVNDVFNAVLVYGDGIDQTMFYGRGAGKLPTASAVLGDVIEAVKHKVTVFSQTWEPAQDQSFVAPVDELSCRWYFRIPDDGGMPDGTVEVFREDGSLSFITSAELSYKDAMAKAEALGALAVYPVLD